MKKVIAVFSVVVGVFILVCDLLFVMVDVVGFASAVAFLFAGAIFLFYGLKHLKTKAPVSSSVPSRVVVDVRPHYSFKVAGIYYRKRRMVEDLGEENDDYLLSKKDFANDGLVDEKVYKYTFSVSKIELIPEPSNPHDPNAIMVVADGTHIGYVPKEKTKIVRELLEAHPSMEVSCAIYGGDYKILEENYDGSFTFEKDHDDFGAEVTIYYSDNKADAQTQDKR